MRLIDCHTRRMVEFTGEDIPPYAILSHTWGKKEVTYKDFGTKEVTSWAGWQKIRRTCKAALSEGIQYAWVDTCCIDKSSSAELTEAINSMFQWYAQSQVCYAFLGDCVGELSEELLASTRWISRGWTLQELIAPQSVIFFNRHWDRVGNRGDLSKSLYNVTGIPENILKNAGWDASSQSLQNIPICKRMSWAARRKTSRVEDAAYCLMGLFGVNMPLLYGEGHRAFIRLQEEIMRRSNDMTIFAWEATANTSHHNPPTTYTTKQPHFYKQS
ncbi:heterokaryon incompatibility protein-domain-containing protein [Pestalotiopsis sp. NC0098]|nr:heterokaryon incompatibility protein-domain-containing protein [Pestalotiopsis sp. NC0098]